MLGVALALTGQLLRALVIGFAYVRRGGKDRQIYAESLQQEGLFAHFCAILVLLVWERYAGEGSPGAGT